jgi:hypothetical protein
MKILLRVVLQWTVLALIRIPLMFLGLFVVPVALLFKTESSLKDPFTEYNTGRSWWLVSLPRWAWIWGNDREGAKGDRRGYWDANGIVWGGSDQFLNQWWWLAVRNPVNNMRFTRGLSVNMREAKTRVLAGQQYVHDSRGVYGWQFLRADDQRFHYYSYYIVKKIGRKAAFAFRIGHKIEMWHNTHDWSTDIQKAWKGFTISLRIGPAK